MSEDTIGVLNFVVHSLVIGAAAWLLVRFVVRDALRRCILANLAVLMCLYGPFNISMQDLFPVKKEVPVWTPIQETFKADWRMSVAPASEPVMGVAAQTRFWDVNEVVRVLRWLFWLVAAALWLRLFYQSIRLQRWARGLRRPSDGEHEKMPAELNPARVRVFDHEGTPCVAGWFFPVIAVPASAFERLTPWQWRWVLRHEAEHLRMHDTVVVLLQNIVRAFLWWNPFAHALMEEYARAREEACDAAAVGQGRDHTAYADFLLGWADRSAPQRECVMAIAYSRPAKRLKVRLVALMEARGVRKKLGALFVLGCLAFAVVVPLIAASFGIATAAAQEPVKPKADDGTLYTRAYTVAHDFLTGAVTPSDPFVPGQTMAGPFVGKTARELLEQKGVTFPPGASAIYNPTTSQLIVRNTNANMELVERVIDTLNQGSKMVHFNCKLVASDQFFGTHGSILSADDFEMLFRSLARMRGIDVMSSPNVTTRFDQKAIAEVAHEVPPKKLQDGTLSGDPKFVGLRFEMNAKAPVKGKFTLETKVDLGLDPDSETPWLLKNEDAADWDKVRIYSVAGRAALASGETLLLHLPTSKGPVTALITANLITELVAAEVATRVYRVLSGFGNGKKPVEYLEDNGVVFAQGASAQLADGRLTVRNTPGNLDLIESLIDSLIDINQGKSVRVTVQAAEMKGDFVVLVRQGLRQDLHQKAIANQDSALTISKTAFDFLQRWLPPQPGHSKIDEILDPALVGSKSTPELIRRQFTTAGIFSPAQFETVRKRIADSNVKIETLKPKGGQQAYKLPAAMGGLEVKVESQIGSDENTIELIIAPDESVPKRITTGVAIWDGQTVVLASQPSEGVSRILFITGNIEDKAGKK